MEAATTVAWEGRFGDADLKIEIPPSGRIHAEWRTPAGSRQKVVDSIEQLERSVLFQLMVGANVRDEVRLDLLRPGRLKPPLRNTASERRAFRPAYSRTLITTRSRRPK